MSDGTPVTGILEQAKMSQSGKSLGLKVNGKWYSCKEFHWQSQVGQEIAFIANVQYFDNGGSITWANDIVLTGAQGPNSVGAPRAPQPPSPPYTPPASYSGSGAQPAARSSAEPMAFMPFVSNTVAHAIQAGAIKSPDQIYPWAQKAFNTAKNLVEGKPVHTEVPADDDFDDDIPF